MKVLPLSQADCGHLALVCAFGTLWLCMAYVASALGG